MIFGGKRRVEEDLERIRKANLSPEKLAQEEQAQAEDRARIAEAAEHLTAKDYLAMAIAALSIIMPYALIIFAVVGVVLFLIKTFYLGG